MLITKSLINLILIILFLAKCFCDDCIKFTTGTGNICKSKIAEGGYPKDIEGTQFCCGVVNGIMYENMCIMKDSFDYNNCCKELNLYVGGNNLKTQTGVTQCPNGTAIINNCVFKKVKIDSSCNGLESKCATWGLDHC